MRELEGLLHHRGEAVAARMSRPGRGGVSELGDFLLLELVNRWEPRVRHLLQQGLIHSERLYATLLELGGDLATFTRDPRRPIEYPVYDHDDPQACFTPLIADLRRSLSMVLEQTAIPIELHERAYGVRVAIMPPVEVQRSATFVLAVAADVPADTRACALPDPGQDRPRREDPRPREPRTCRASRCARCRWRRARSPTARDSTTSSSTPRTSSGASSSPRAALRCTSRANSRG